jgi:hypothetical protein
MLCGASAVLGACMFAPSLPRLAPSDDDTRDASMMVVGAQPSGVERACGGAHARTVCANLSLNAEMHALRGVLLA